MVIVPEMLAEAVIEMLIPAEMGPGRSFVKEYEKEVDPDTLACAGVGQKKIKGTRHKTQDTRQKTRRPEDLKAGEPKRRLSDFLVFWLSRLLNLSRTFFNLVVIKSDIFPLHLVDL
jgi:hypothetical protein